MRDLLRRHLLLVGQRTAHVLSFQKVGNYTSYCRCVKSSRTSNDKKKGENNRKNGNRYLSWAYVKAANFIRL